MKQKKEKKFDELKFRDYMMKNIEHSHYLERKHEYDKAIDVCVNIVRQNLKDWDVI